LHRWSSGIKTASASDLNETNAASRIVTGNTELPDDMKSVPDNQWSEDQVNCYIENLISNEIIKKSISNFDALEGISAASASSQTDVLRQMNAAQQHPAPETPGRFCRLG